MTGTTPVFGIPYPDGTTKAVNLGPELRDMGLGVEAALAAAGVPAVTNPDRAVASSELARNTHFGVPSTDADRLALQRRGAECIRTDMGWTERYFAAYNATTNPGGAASAGWYPVGGLTPAFLALGGGAQTLTAGWTKLASAFGTPRVSRGVLWSGGAINIQQPGLYRVYGHFTSLSITGAGTRGIQITLNADSPDTAASIIDAQNATTAIGGASGGVDLPLKSGDVLRMFAVATGNGTPALSTSPRTISFGASYQGPA